MSDMKYKGAWFVWERSVGEKLTPVIYTDGITADEAKRIVVKYPVTPGFGLEGHAILYPAPKETEQENDNG